MKKIIFLIAACMIMAPLTANAEIDSAYTSTSQFLENIGYSPDAGRIVEVHLVDPYAPVKESKKLTTSEKFKRVASYLFPGEYDNWDYPSHSTVHDHVWWTDY